MELKYKHTYTIDISRKEVKEGLLNINPTLFKEFIVVDGRSIESSEDLEEVFMDFIWENYYGETLFDLNPGERQDDINTDSLKILNLKEFISEFISEFVKVLTCCDKNAKYLNGCKFCPDCGKEIIR